MTIILKWFWKVVLLCSLSDLRGESWAGTLLVSYCFCNKLLQSQWLKTTYIYYLSVLEARSTKGASWSRYRDVGRAVFLGRICGLCFSSFHRLLRSLTCGPFLHLRSQQGRSSGLVSVVTSPSLILLPPFSLFKGRLNERKQVRHFRDLGLHWARPEKPE